MTTSIEGLLEPIEMRGRSDLAVPYCPSAAPQPETGFAFGVVGGTAADPLVAYLSVPLSITDELLRLAAPVSPTEVFRFAAPCAGSGCVHFDGANCQLARRVATDLPEVVSGLPACRLRPRCRWWQQEGRDACLRCPQVVTESPAASDAFRLAATPT